MDKVLQITIGATVLLMVASIVMFMVSDQSGDFSNFIDDQSTGAKCDLWEAQYEKEVCEDGGTNSDLSTKLSDQCGGTPC